MTKKTRQRIKDLEKAITRIESHLARTLCEAKKGIYYNDGCSTSRCYVTDWTYYELEKTSNGFRFVSVEEKVL